MWSCSLDLCLPGSHNRCWESKLSDLNHVYEIIVSLRLYNEEKVKLFILPDCKLAKMNVNTEESLECREWVRIKLPTSHIHNLPTWVSGFNALYAMSPAPYYLMDYWFSPCVLLRLQHRAAVNSLKHCNTDSSLGTVMNFGCTPKNIGQNSCNLTLC